MSNELSQEDTNSIYDSAWAYFYALRLEESYREETPNLDDGERFEEVNEALRNLLNNTQLAMERAGLPHERQDVADFMNSAEFKNGMNEYFEAEGIDFHEENPGLTVPPEYINQLSMDANNWRLENVESTNIDPAQFFDLRPGH